MSGLPLARRPLLTRLALTAAVPALLLAGCGGKDDAGPSAKLRVAAALYPVQEAAQRIGGDRVQVDELTPVGGQPHDLQPSPAATDALNAAKVVLYVGGGFQPAVEAAVTKLPTATAKIDLLGSQTPEPQPEPISGIRAAAVAGGTADASSPDPHVWVDPARFIRMAEEIQAALVKADPAGKAAYEQRGAAYVRELRSLDAAYRQGLAGCSGRVLLTTHPAFGYLTREYGLTQAVTAGIVPGSAPDPASLRATGRYARAKRVKTLYLAVPAPQRLARQVKEATGATTDVLNPVEGLTQDQLTAKTGYVAIMRDNLASLQQGLGCTGDDAAATTAGSTPATTPGE